MKIISLALVSTLLLGVSAEAQAEMIEGIDVRGGNAFIERTSEALKLLRTAGQIDFLRRYVKVIISAERSGMRAYANPPTYEVGPTTWQASTLWYAGTIAHDAYHSKLYHEAKAKKGGGEPDQNAWTGASAERQCLDFQSKVLGDLGADSRTLDYVRGLTHNPTYQGDPKSRADYRRRSW